MDFSQILSGPYCTQLLGDLGADIYKVEPLYGDGTRKWGPPFIKGESAYFLSINRNKKSIAMDLTKRPEATSIALRMASKCDVLIENFRPGVMSKLGLDYDVVRKHNSRIVYCSLSGYGQSGPLSHKPGYDIAAFAASGIMSITGEEGGTPVKVGVPVADIGSGMFSALAITSALLGIRTKPNSKGVYLDISMYDSMISWLTFQAGYYFATGKNPKPLGSAHPLLVPYQAFRANDRYFILAVGSDALWTRACEAIKRKDLASAKKFATVSSRISNRKILISTLERIFAEKSASHWLKLFDKAGVPSSPISTVGEALQSNHTQFRHIVENVNHTSAKAIKSIRSPITLMNGKKIRSDDSAPPLLGEHTVEILSSFNYSDRDIDIFLKKKIVAEASG